MVRTHADDAAVVGRAQRKSLKRRANRARAVQNETPATGAENPEVSSTERAVLDGRAELYRYYDKGGRLLYVGVSLSSLMRLTQHRRERTWFDRVSKITIERFPTRAAALAAERNAIRMQRPLFNLAHTGFAYLREEPHPLAKYAEVTLLGRN